MTNLWDKILSASGLPECRSIAEHICAAVVNSGDTVLITRNPLFGKVQKINPIPGLLQKISPLNGKVQKICHLQGEIQYITPLLGTISKI